MLLDAITITNYGAPRVKPEAPVVPTGGRHHPFFVIDEDDGGVAGRESSMWSYVQEMKLINRFTSALAILLAAKLVVSASEIVYRLKRPALSGFIHSLLLDGLADTQHIDVFKAGFSTVPSVQPSDRTNSPHTHPTAAARRSAAGATIREIARHLSLFPYSYQASLSEQRSGVAGARSWFWAKDVRAKPSGYNPGPMDLVYMVDTDHYVDINYLITREFRPFILRTLQPKAVAYTGEDISYTFDSLGTLTMCVAGGGSYSHQVWNYQRDSFSVFEWVGLQPIYTVGNIERRVDDAHHDLVAIMPTRQWRGIPALLAFLRLGAAQPITRYQPFDRLNHAASFWRRVYNGLFNPIVDLVPEGFNIIRTLKTGGESTISVGYPGSYTCANLPLVTFDAALDLAKTTKADLTLPSVESLLQDESPSRKDEVKLLCSVVVAYARMRLPPKPFHVFPLEQAVRRYQYGKYDQDAPQTLQPFMSPLWPGAFAPDHTLGNETVGVQERIEKPQARAAAKTTVTPFVSRCMDEFLALLIPTPFTLSPTDEEEVADRQNRPSQTALLNLAATITRDFSNIVSSFVKKEAYGKPAFPRVISTFQPRLKLDYSKVIYPFVDHCLKHQPWYAFGKTPKEVAEKVSRICCASKFVVVNDFETFDGTIYAISRELERRALLRAFQPRWHEYVVECHESHCSRPGVTTQGYKYNTGFARSSGGADTSAFNTMDNAFAHFVAMRMTRVNGQFYQDYDAWQWLSTKVIVGGDDGTSGDTPDALKDACDMMGYIMTPVKVERGQFGVEFLARMYGPDVWYGDDNSTCDLGRQLKKLHTTVRVDPKVTPEQKAIQKARSFMLTDGNTPVIGQWSALVLQAAAREGVEFDDVLQLRRWLDQYDAEVQYPNDVESWAGYVLGTVPEFSLDTFEAWLAAIGPSPRLTTLLNPPVCVEAYNVLPKRGTVVVDDDILTSPTPAAPPPPPPPADAKPKVVVRLVPKRKPAAQPKTGVAKRVRLPTNTRAETQSGPQQKPKPSQTPKRKRVGKASGQ